MTRVALFHTVAALSGRFEELADEYLDDAEWYHAVDESVLDDMLDAGELTPNVTERICTQLSLAQRGGADVVLDTCSSTSPAVDVARKLVDVPIVKIDDPMTERAVELGEHRLAQARGAGHYDGFEMMGLFLECAPGGAVGVQGHGRAFAQRIQNGRTVYGS